LGAWISAAQYTLRNKIYCDTIPPVAKDAEPNDDRRSIERELKRGSLELIVLHLLASGEAYGYEIVSKLTAETNGALEVTDGTLYPVLYRLERAGFVTVRWETPERGVPRKYYRLTDTGRDELERLTHEWTTFAKAMTKLLRQSREG
jgi:PadR family transcriptional regulator PadR